MGLFFERDQIFSSRLPFLKASRADCTGPDAPRKILTPAPFNAAVAFRPICPVITQSTFSPATRFPVAVPRVTQCVPAVFSFAACRPESGS
jgi:hypothetical protein